MKNKHNSMQCISKNNKSGIMAHWFGFGMAALLLFSGASNCAQAANFGIQWQGTGVPITDAGGAFGVPTANWLTLTPVSGSQIFSPPSGGALTITWSAGGGVFSSSTTFPGFSSGENQVLSGCLYASHNDPGCGGPITVTITGLNSVAAGSYTVQLMASINANALSFQPATFGNGDILNFSTPTTAANSSIAAVTTNITESGDSITFNICDDEIVAPYPRAILSGLVITYTPGPSPVIAPQPLSQTASQGGTVTFTSGATGGTGSLTYQWQKNDSDIAGQTSTSLTLSGVADSDSANYRLTVTDGNADVSYSSEAQLVVVPSIGSEVVYDPSTMTSMTSTNSFPAGVANYFSVVAGTSLTVNKLGFDTPNDPITGTVTVQLWDVNAVQVLGTVTFTSSDTGTASGDSTVLHLASPTSPITLGPGTYAIAQYGGFYANVPVSETINTANGAIVNGYSKYNGLSPGPGNLPSYNDGLAPNYLGPTLQVTVSGAAAITQQPVGGAFNPGATVTLSVTGGGSLPLTYQWKKNGSPVGGATNRTLVLSSVTISDTASYTVSVNNSFNLPVTSAAAVVTIAARPTLAIQLDQGILVSGTVGGHYQVQYSTALNPTTWLLLQDIPALPSSPYLVVDPIPTSAGRSYRAILP
jgi:hypothetical protein